MTQSPTALNEALIRLDETLRDVVRELGGEDAAKAMTDADIRTLTPLAESIGRGSDLLRIVVAGEIDDRSRPERGEARMSATYSCANAAELLTRLTGVSAATAKDRMRLASAVATTTGISGESLLSRFPAVRTGLADGVIGVDSASAIIRTLGPIAGRANPSDLAAAEHELVAAAAGTSCDGAAPVGADETQIQAKVWALVLDPDGTLPAYERAMRKRSLTLGREFEGLVPIRGRLLPDVAEQLRRLIHAHLSPRVEDRTQLPGAVAFVAADDADDPVVPHDARSYPQKQHDVLASVLAVAARAPETPTLGGAAPMLLVTIAASDLDKHDGVACIDGTDETVPAFVARQIACCGGIQRVVFGPMDALSN